MQIDNRYTLHEIESFFSKEKMRPGQVAYGEFHKLRYQRLLDILRSIVTEESMTLPRILDIGPRHQTNLIRAKIAPSIVNTMGFQWEHNQVLPEEYHVDVDLNETQNVDLSEFPKNDIIVFAEVIEHLYTMPEVILEYLKINMNIGGYMIIQTPNGVALDRRVKMLFGINPFQMIEPNRQNHYREYTLRELIDIVTSCGYTVCHSEITNYLNPNKTFGQRLYNKLGVLMPSGLRSGITMVLKWNG